MPDNKVTVSDALLGDDYAADGPVVIHYSDGRIRSVTKSSDASRSRRRLLMPAFANAHDHARPLSTTSFGASGKPLETWLLRLAVLPSVDPYLAAAAAFGRAAEGGCASVMVHYTRPQGPMDLPEEAAIVARAAQDVGVRMAFAVALRDRNPLVYGDDSQLRDSLPVSARTALERYFNLPKMSVAEQIDQVDAVAEAVGSEGADVQYGPTGVQWCSEAMLEAIAEASARTGRRIHMHLLETLCQRDYLDHMYPGGVVRRLHEIGLLSPRLTLAHCVWARPDELEMLAESGVTIAINTSSNLHLRSGIAPLEAMRQAGCRIAMGLDGCALDEDDDALRELRLNTLLHDEVGFAARNTRQEMLRRSTGNGRASVGATGSGVIAVGEPADWMTLDLDGLDRDRIMPVAPEDLLFSRATRSYLDELVVAGRTVVSGGTVSEIDLTAVQEQLRAQFRQALGERNDLISAWPPIENAVARFYRDRLGCC